MSTIKDMIHEAADELGQYAKSEEARGEAWVRGKLIDIDVYLRGLWSKPVALSVAVIALLLGLLVGWSMNESRHGHETPRATVEETR
jgi:hypothetical protein